MMVPEDPPSFVVRTEAQKAAWDNGFRLERGVESGGWLRYGSTTARGEIWIAIGCTSVTGLQEKEVVQPFVYFVETHLEVFLVCNASRLEL